MRPHPLPSGASVAPKPRQPPEAGQTDPADRQCGVGNPERATEQPAVYLRAEARHADPANAYVYRHVRVPEAGPDLRDRERRGSAEQRHRRPERRGFDDHQVTVADDGDRVALDLQFQLRRDTQRSA